MGADGATELSASTKQETIKLKSKGGKHPIEINHVETIQQVLEGVGAGNTAPHEHSLAARACKVHKNTGVIDWDSVGVGQWQCRSLSP